MKLVSIVIPIYNGEKYIDRCISRLLKQTYQNIEILCIPNNCTDGSVALCKAWEKRERRVKVFVNEQKGTSLARKRGVLEAQGEYILFVDCDDQYVSKNAVEKMVKAIVEDGSQICQFDYIVQYPIQFLRRKIRVVQEKRIYSRVEMLTEVFLGVTQGRGGNFNISACTKIYTSNVLKSAVQHINEALTCGDDTQLNLFAFSDILVEKVSSRKEAYYVYRVGRGITTNPNAIWMLLHDYQVTKLQVSEVARNRNVEEFFFYHLWSEALYCFRDAVNSCLYAGLDKATVLARIAEVDTYEYMRMAKKFYQDQIEKGWLDTIEAKEYLFLFEKEKNSDNLRFMCSDYSCEEYYDWCIKNLPEQSVAVKIKKLMRKLA